MGEDKFGRFLARVLRGNGVDISGLRFSREAPTTLAFVHLDDRGERTFSIDFANAVGALCVAGKGAIPAMPSLAAVEECRRRCSRLFTS